jgi:maltose-binding protein MalE
MEKCRYKNNFYTEEEYKELYNITGISVFRYIFYNKIKKHFTKFVKNISNYDQLFNHGRSGMEWYKSWSCNSVKNLHDVLYSIRYENLPLCIGKYEPLDKVIQWRLNRGK